MTEWRFHLQDVPSGTWVDRDLPLGDPKVTRTVSAPASISGYLPLGNASGKSIKEWGSLIVAHEVGRNPVVAIVDSLTVEGDQLKIEAGGFAMYPTGMPWPDTEFSSTSVDPLAVVRLIWSTLQAKPGGNLGVTVDSETSKVRLGVPESAARTKAKALVAEAKAKEDAGKLAYEAAVKEQNNRKITLLAAAGRGPNGIILHQDAAPAGDKRTGLNFWIDKNDWNKGYVWDSTKWVLQTVSSQAVIDVRLAAWLNWGAEVVKTKATHAGLKEIHSTAKTKLSEVQGGEAEYFSLSWWETRDVGAVIDDLAKKTPFEYREVSTWTSPEMKALNHRLELGVPTLGARRPDLRFEIGVNVSVSPPLQESDYASEVTVLGAGEGRSMMRASSSLSSNRLRRAVVVERKDLRTQDQIYQTARAEVAARAAEWTFDTLNVIDHPMAPYGSYQPGDQILVTGDAGWRTLNDWVRVLEIEIDCITGAQTLRVEAT